MPKEYAIYLRKSRADREAEQRGEGETLARHEQTCLEVAKKQGLPITKIYKEVVSGESIEARPQVQELLAAVEQGKYAGVIVMEVERLARGDTVDQGIVARAFSTSHTKIITPIKTYDPDNEFDEEYFEFGLFMSRREYKVINRRIQRGRVASAKEGRFIGSTPPYGYDKVKIPKDKGYTLAPNENEAPVVQRIYNMYNSGAGMITIANALDADGIKPRNRDYWSRSTISDILRNPVYTGKIRWSYRPYVKQSSGGKISKTRTKNDECIMVMGLHEALISDELYEAVQDRLKRLKKAPVKSETTLQNPLTGLVFCAKCGAAMTRLGKGTRNEYATLRCSDRRCDTVSSRLDLVESSTLELLAGWLDSYKLKLKAEQPTVIEFGTHERALNNAHAELAKVEKQIEQTFDLLEQQVYDVPTFQQRNQLLAAKREDLAAEIERLEDEIEKAHRNRQAYKYIIPRVQKVLEVYHTLESAEAKNEMLKSVIDHITYRKDAPNRKGQGDQATFTLKVMPRIDSR